MTADDALNEEHVIDSRGELQKLGELLSEQRFPSSAESQLLETLSRKYIRERSLSDHLFSDLFFQVFDALVKNRLDSDINVAEQPVSRDPLLANHSTVAEHRVAFYKSEYFLRILIWIKIFIRDPTYQKELFHSGGVKILANHLQSVTKDYLNFENEVMGIEVLKVMTNIFQKLSVEPSQRLWLMACNVPRSLVLLLCARDLSVLNCALFALIDLARSEQARVLIGDLNCVETLLHILQDYTDTKTKRLCSELLRQLCSLDHIKEQVKVFDGIPLCLSVLHEDDLMLQNNLVSIVERLSIDNDSSNDIRELGGIPLLLTLIQEHYKGSELETTANTKLDSLKLQSACCAALTQLSLNDANAQNIVKSNGVFIIAKLILPNRTGTTTSRTGSGSITARSGSGTTTASTGSGTTTATPEQEEEEELVELVQKTALRALRFLFSMERNRQIFKRLFSKDLFEMFIDVGHYITNTSAYKHMVHYINNCDEETQSLIECRIYNTNKNRAPIFYTGQYAVLEHLGSGAFGSVYKVRKTMGSSEENTILAMKEIPLQHPAFGTTLRERTKCIGDILNETNIIKEQLRHPNIVRYYKAFKEQHKLYIVMQLIDGAPLSEHFSSLREKGLSFSEERIWKIFVQMVLALRYLHCEKGIVHRDLTPNNIMLGDHDKVTLTDFGLSRQKQGLMQSVVGTILYSCPELVQNQAYGNKADVWAIGCLLYQMCTLTHPFYCTGMSTLALAKNIVESIYEPIPEERYSPKVISTVQQCLTADPAERQDIVGIGSYIAEIVMVHLDEVRTREFTLQKKLLRERKRVQKHYHESNRNLQNYQRLFLVTNQTSASDQCVKCSRSSYGTSTGDESSLDTDTDSSPPTRTSRTGGRCSKCRPRNSSLPSYPRVSQTSSATARPSHIHSGTCADSAGSRCRRSNSSGSKNLSAATISISQRKVKQIEDPILQLLNQLHKIIYVTQLPPSLVHDPKRRVIEKYKRALFTRHVGSLSLKHELKRLMEASEGMVDLSFCTQSGQVPNLPSSNTGSNSLLNLTVEGPEGVDVLLTYDHLQSLIENCLVETGYYEVQGHRTPALPPIEKFNRFGEG